jgi:ribosome recycling factor
MSKKHTIADLDLKNIYSHEFEKLVEIEMQEPIKHFERELIAIRSGRAHTSMVEDIKVICYNGSQLVLKEVAALSAPEARMIVIQPWDKGIITDIEKALLASSLGITPFNDGNLIRIQLPEISTQRREELVKVLHKKLEEIKERIRIVRGEFRNTVKEAERKHEIAEDFSKTLQDLLQKIHDKYIVFAQQMSDKKEKDIRMV